MEQPFSVCTVYPGRTQKHYMGEQVCNLVTLGYLLSRVEDESLIEIDFQTIPGDVDL